MRFTEAEKTVYKAWGSIIGVLAIVCGVVIISVLATNTNNANTKLCESHDMVVAREWPHGPYGCATVIPFEELR